MGQKSCLNVANPSLYSLAFCYSLPLPLKQIRYLSVDSDNVWNFLQAPLLCIYKIYKCLYSFVWRYLNHYKCLRFPRFVISFRFCKPLKSSRESYIYLLISLQLTALCNLSICFEFDWKWRYKYSNNNNKKQQQRQQQNPVASILQTIPSR